MRGKDIPILDHSSRLSRNSELIFSKIDNEIVLLGIQNGEYYNLNEIGAFIWELLSNPMTLVEVTNALVENFEITPEECYQDIEPFIIETLKKGIFNVSNE